MFGCPSAVVGQPPKLRFNLVSWGKQRIGLSNFDAHFPIKGTLGLGDVFHSAHRKGHCQGGGMA